MEFFTGVLFALAFYIFGFSWEFLIALGIIAMLIIIACTDINYYIIPDNLLLFFAIYFFILQLIILGLRGAVLQLMSGLLLFVLIENIDILNREYYLKVAKIVIAINSFYHK